MMCFKSSYIYVLLQHRNRMKEHPMYVNMYVENKKPLKIN